MDKNGVAISSIQLSSVHEGAEGLVYGVCDIKSDSSVATQGYARNHSTSLEQIHIVFEIGRAHV